MGFPWYSTPWNAHLSTTNTNLDILVVVFYFLLVLGIGLWVRGAQGGGGALDTSWL